MNTYTVKFATEDRGTILDVNSEPQFVKVRSNNNYYVILDSEDMYQDDNKADIMFSGANTPTAQPYPIVSRTKRFTVSSIFFTCDFYNVTPNNNGVSVLLNNSITLNGQVPIGVYSTSNSLMVAVCGALNAALVLLGLPSLFTSSLISGTGNQYTISSNLIPGNQYRFIDTCTAITKGKTVYNLPVGTITAPTQQTGPVDLRYPRKIQVCSRALMQYTKMHNHSTNNRANILTNIVHNKPGPLSNPFIQFSERSWVNFDESANLAQIDIQLIDENGDLVYIPPTVQGRQHLFYILTLLCEM